MKEIIKFQVKDQKFNSEEEAIKFWLTLGNIKKYYSIFKLRDSHCYEYKINELTASQVDEYLKTFNTVGIHYKTSNRTYCIKSVDKIDMKNLKNIILMELRGINGNVTGGIRIEYINDKFIAIS